MKVLRKTFKSRVALEEETKVEILQISKILIHLWNKALDQCEYWLDQKTPTTERKLLTAFSINYWLPTVKNHKITLSDDSEHLFGDLSTDLSREVCKKLIGSYQSFFNLKKNKDNRAKKPRKKSESWFQTMSWSSFKIKMEDKAVVILVPSRNRQCIRFVLDDYLVSCIHDRTVKHVTLAQDRDGQFWLSLVCASELPNPPKHPQKIRAIDVGAGDLAISDSDGKCFLVPSRRPDKYWRKVTRQIEERMRKRKKSSRGYNRLAEARRKCWNKSASQHKSHQRKLADAIVSDGVDCVVVGKHTIRLGLSQSENGNADQHFGSQNTGYLFQLILFIKEKCAERGVHFVEFPDPKREGNLDDPQSKLHASKTLLALSCKKFEVQMPDAFSKRSFAFKK